MTVPWFKTAVFYEVPVYAFADENGDGTGDFPGLTSHLDYLEWLGIDCLWILPFYDSPLRDGGYDISDYRAVLSRYGTMDDLTTLLTEAHRRGLRVIADIVINHTSSQHPWFLDAREPGSPNRDRYVWSDTPDRYAEARVIFTDTHDSNWTWDPVAGAYYWHRFFDHQPDLNFENAEVRAEMKAIIRFWLDRGFDGLRLDAVPYLFEEEGTNGENLPKTHAYLKELRAMVDAEYPGRILLAEANQWPVDVVEYFGHGDECHMAFHFPVMPRLFLALKRGDAGPVVDVLEQTPELPAECQWGVFLRNHDELTLEMVSPDEREEMYGYYAPDPAMRKNVGIRRRLAPLLNGDRRKITVLHAVLLSLPGSPILYYGDEIGMGDEYLLDDRDGVRTPMQWTSEVTAGFSSAEPENLYLPLVATSGYEPRSVNVAAARSDADSLLNWLRSMLAVRRHHPVLGTGLAHPIASDHSALLAFLRTGPDERILVVANLSEASVVGNLTVQPHVWTQLAGSPDASIDGTAVTLPPYGFLWVTTSGSE